jgi:hypothetical protein
MHNVSELVVGCGVWCMSLRVGGNGFVEQPVSAGCQHHIAARCRGARRAESQDAPPSEPSTLQYNVHTTTHWTTSTFYTPIWIFQSTNVRATRLYRRRGAIFNQWHGWHYGQAEYLTTHWAISYSPIWIFRSTNGGARLYHRRDSKFNQWHG